MKRSLLSFLLSGCIGISLAQSSKSRLEKDYHNYPYWIEMMQDPTANFFETQKAFNLYWKDRKIEKGGGYKPFKRWEHFMALQVDERGNKPQPAEINEQIQATQSSIDPESLGSGGWQEVGPVTLPANGTGQPNGLGRINAIGFHPTDSNTFYVGAPAGGLWKTTDGGSTWSSNTDGLATLGVSSIVVDHSDPNTVFFGSGDRDGGDSPGLGVYKSTDGGSTWVQSNTGMGNRTVGALIMDPTNANTLLAATNGAIYRSTNGGANWTTIQYGNFKDIKFHPTNSSIVYAATGGNLYKSTDNGASFSLSMNGIPTGKSRLVIGVTPDAPNTVYILSSQGAVFGGLFKSSDSGASFTTQSNTPNIMDYSYTGSGTSGQAWYDMCIAVNPDDSNEIYAGGINVFKSTDGGVTWNISAHWVGNATIDGIHADQHVLEYSTTGKLYVGNDGGVYHKGYSDEEWTDISSGLAISQCYKLGQSQTDLNKVIVGYQDNGTGIYDNGDWRTEIGGDGMEAIIDYTDPNYMYGELYYGNIRRSTNGGYSFYNIAGNGINGINESGAWVTPYVIHETDPNTMFAGYEDIWRTTNVKSSSVSWTAISTNLGGTSKFSVLEHNEANGDILYAAKGSTLYKSEDVMASTVTWTTLTVPGSGNILSIETSELNENIVYVSRGFKIYESTDKGVNWTDITSNINNIQYKSSLVYAPMAIGQGLYVATDYGVFFKPENETNWINYTAGLPAYSKIKEIEIYEDPNGDNHKIRAVSFGRGLWTNDIYITNTPNVTVTDTLLNICDGASATLTASDAVSYFWKDQAGTTIGTTTSITVSPSQSTTYTAYGVMSGGDTTSVDVVVNVETVTLTLSGNTTVCDGDEVNLTLSGADTYIWSGAVTGTSNSVQFTPSGNTQVYVTGTSATGCTQTDTFDITVLPNPVVATTNDNSACNGDAITITASGADTYTWSTGETTASIVVPSSSGLNSVWVVGQTNGCSSDTVIDALTWIPNPVVTVDGDMEVCAGDMVSLTATGADSYLWSNGATTATVSFTATTDVTLSVVGETNGCSSASVSANVEVQAYPVLNVSGATEVCVGEVVTLTASGASSYTWSVANEGSSNNILEFTAQEDTVITLTGTTTFGCSVSQNISIQTNAHPTVAVTTDNSACEGESITITASGATSYTWSTGETTASIVVPSSSGLNSVWVVGQSNGCLSDTVTSALTWIANPVVIVGGSTSVCAGETVTLSASGADSYVWSTGETTSSISFTATEDSTVSVTGMSNGCSSSVVTIPVSVQEHPTLVISGYGAYCAGETVTLSASGASTYLWSTGETTSSISFIATEDSTVSLVGTTNGCSSNANATVTVNAVPVVAISGNTTLCAGESTTLTASGADSYVWSNGATTASVTLTPSSDSTLTVVGTTNGCSSNVVSSSIVVNAIPSVSVSGTTAICEGESTTLTASGADSYVWSNGATTASVTLTPSSDSTLTVIGTTNGCSSDVVTSNIVVSPNPVVAVSGNTAVCEGETVTLTASGATSYLWSNGATGATIQFTASSSETITVTGTTGICSSNAQANIVVEPTPVVTISGETQVCSDETITLTASGADSYVWSNGATTASVTIAIPNGSNQMDVSVVGTTNGCASASVSTQLSWLTNPTVVISGAGEICDGDVITLTASGADTYVWSTGATTPSITFSSSVGDSTVTVEGFKNGCSSAMASATVTVNAMPVVSITGDSEACEGDLVTLTASGADSYLWSTGATTPSIEVTASQTETISVTGTSLNCSASASTQLTVNPTPAVIVGGNTVACDGETITLSASGADSYVWSTGETTASIQVTSNVSSVTVTGTTNGCSSDVVSIPLTWKPTPVVAVSGNTTICEGESVTLTASGADSYVWSTGATTASITLSPSANTSVTVTGTTNGCSSDIVTSNIVVNANPIVSISGPTVVCEGDLVTLTASGAAQYTWADGSTTASVQFNATADTTVQVTGTNAAGCSTVSNISITVNPTPVVTVSGDNSVCVGETITLTASGADSYVWSTGATTASITVTDSAVHNVSVVGTTNGCSSTSVNTNLTWILNPDVVISAPSQVCSGDVITFTASGADSYVWSTGATTASITMTATTDTIVSVTGTSNGCSTTTVSSNVVVNTTPVVAVSGNTTICNGESVTLTASGADSYVWSTGATTASITISPSANTSVTVTGTTNGCSSDVVTSNIVVNAVPTVVVSGDEAICEGESVTLTANGNIGGGSYLWSTGATTASITLSPSADSNVSVVYTVNGCSSDQANHLVAVNVVPVVSVSGNTQVCSGEVVTLTASGADSYLWSTGETTASIDLSPTANMDVTVTGTTNGCTSDLVTANLVVNASSPVSISGNTAVCSGESVVLTANGGGAYLWSTGETTSSITITPTDNQAVSVQATNNGCSSTAEVIMTVSTGPNVQITGNTEGCAGEVVELVATGADSYVWSTGATTPSINVTVSGNQAISVIGTTNGCSSQANTSVVESAGASYFVIEIKTDEYGYETTWKLDDESGATVASHTIAANGYLDNFAVYRDTVHCAIVGNCYKFTIYDDYGDGMCCEYGEGMYRIIQNDGTVLAEGGSFGASETKDFCIGGGAHYGVQLSSYNLTTCPNEPFTVTATGADSYMWYDVNGNLISELPTLMSSSNASTTYTVLGITGNDTNAVDFSLTVKELDVQIVGPTEVCEGDKVWLNVQGARHVEWFNGKKSKWIKVKPTETTVYTVTGVSDNGCPFTLFHTVNVVEGNYVKIKVKTDWYGSETSWKLFDSNGDEVASVDPGTYGNNQMNTKKVTCLQDECYTLEVYDTYGDGMCCTYGYGFFKVINEDGDVIANGGQFGYETSASFCLGDAPAMALPYDDMLDGPSPFNARTVPPKEITNDLSAISVYPNPTVGELNISALETDYLVDKYEIMDVTGRVLISQSYEKPFKQEIVDISSFTEGNYFVKLYVGNQVKVVKIVKE